MAFPAVFSVSGSGTVIQPPGGGAQSVPVPSNASGDLIVLIEHFSPVSSMTYAAFPSGFGSPVIEDISVFRQGMRVWTKISAGSEGANYSVERATGAVYSVMSVVVVRGVDGTTPTEDVTLGAASTGTATVDIPTVDSTGADSLLLGIVWEYEQNARTFTAAGSMAEVFDNGGSGSFGFAVYSEDIASAGSISGRTATGSASSNYKAAAIVVKSAAASGPVLTGPSGKQMTGGFFDLSGGTS